MPRYIAGNIPTKSSEKPLEITKRRAWRWTPTMSYAAGRRILGRGERDGIERRPGLSYFVGPGPGWDRADAGWSQLVNPEPTAALLPNLAADRRRWTCPGTYRQSPGRSRCYHRYWYCCYLSPDWAEPRRRPGGRPRRRSGPGRHRRRRTKLCSAVFASTARIRAAGPGHTGFACQGSHAFAVRFLLCDLPGPARSNRVAEKKPFWIVAQSHTFNQTSLLVPLIK